MCRLMHSLIKIILMVFGMNLIFVIIIIVVIIMVIVVIVVIGYLDNHGYRGDYYANYDSCGGEDGDGYVGECAVSL